MRASVLVAAHNEGDALWKTIRACVETTIDLSYDIVVADDASSDGSVEEAVRRFPQVRVVRQSERLGASPTKHLAALEADGDVLVFLDGHTNPEFGAINRLVQDVEQVQGQAILTPAVPHLDTTHWVNSRSQVGHGYGMQLDSLTCRWLPLNELPVREIGRTRFHESPALIGCALAVSRELYQKLNGFDART
jgi:glycosyltransferase involved in cell wall biosynthesis